MNINYAHFGVLSKDIKVLKRERTTNLAQFFEPIGEDKSCFFALPAFHLYTDTDFLTKNTDFCFDLLDKTLKHLNDSQKQEALLFCLEVAGNFSIQSNDKYQAFKPQLLALTNEHLELSFYKVNKGLGLRSGHTMPDLNSLLNQIFSIFAHPIKSSNILPNSLEAKKLLDKILTLKNQDLVFIPSLKEEFLIGSSCFSCFKSFIDCAIELNEVCAQPIDKNKFKDLIINSIMSDTIPKGEDNNDWVDAKKYFDINSKLQKYFFIQKTLFFEDYIWGILDSHQNLFKINPSKLYKIARTEAAYALQKEKKIALLGNKKLTDFKIDYESLESYMSYFNFNQSVKNTHQWSAGYSLKDYVERGLKVFKKIRKSNLITDSQKKSLIDRSFIDVIVSLGREKKYKESIEVAQLCSEPLNFLLSGNCKLTEFIHSGDDGFFSLFLSFLIDKNLINPFNCNVVNFADVAKLEKTFEVLNYTHHALLTKIDKTIIEGQIELKEMKMAGKNKFKNLNYCANKI